MTLNLIVYFINDEEQSMYVYSTQNPATAVSVSSESLSISRMKLITRCWRGLSEPSKLLFMSSVCELTPSKILSDLTGSGDFHN